MSSSNVTTHRCTYSSQTNHFNLVVALYSHRGLLYPTREPKEQHSLCMYWWCDSPGHLLIISIMLKHEDHVWAMTAIDPVNLLITLVNGLNQSLRASHELSQPRYCTDLHSERDYRYIIPAAAVSLRFSIFFFTLLFSLWRTAGQPESLMPVVSKLDDLWPLKTKQSLLVTPQHRFWPQCGHKLRAVYVPRVSFPSQKDFLRLVDVKSIQNFTKKANIEGKLRKRSDFVWK